MQENLFNLDGRVALVTGASSWGIGSESARLLAANGAKVFITARREDKLAEMAAKIEAEGGEVAYMAIDVASEEQCKAAVEACVEKFGRLDIMVLAAGIAGKSISGGPEAVFDTENWRNVLGINLDGVFWMVKYGYEHCAKNGVGSIIPISSLAALHADGAAAYTATKGALRSLTKWFGNYLAPMGVRYNTVYPGFIDTDMTHMITVLEQVKPIYDRMLSEIPMKHPGEPEDIANAVLYLASDASKFVTGQDMVVDGGQLCH